MGRVTNNKIADILERVADLMETQNENPYRIRSYHNAGRTIRQLNEPVSKLVKNKGSSAIEEIPGIGSKLAGVIKEILDTGRLSLEEQLEGEISPEKVLSEILGIGQKLAGKIHDELGISSLEELEIAAYDGRLTKLEGIGPQKAESIRLTLAGKLSRSARRKLQQIEEGAYQDMQDEPSVNLLLELDQEYRTKAEKNELKKITPKRFNPENKQWLPIMKDKREGWEFTLLFSNTANAHKRGKTKDWVVIYYEKSGHQEQCTVITAERGQLKGKRIVRGREKECQR